MVSPTQAPVQPAEMIHASSSSPVVAAIVEAAVSSDSLGRIGKTVSNATNAAINS